MTETSYLVSASGWRPSHMPAPGVCHPNFPGFQLSGWFLTGSRALHVRWAATILSKILVAGGRRTRKNGNLERRDFFPPVSKILLTWKAGKPRKVGKPGFPPPVSRILVTGGGGSNKETWKLGMFYKFPGDPPHPPSPQVAKILERLAGLAGCLRVDCIEAHKQVTTLTGKNMPPHGETNISRNVP